MLLLLILRYDKALSDPIQTRSRTLSLAGYSFTARNNARSGTCQGLDGIGSCVPTTHAPGYRKHPLTPRSVAASKYEIAHKIGVRIFWRDALPGFSH